MTNEETGPGIFVTLDQAQLLRDMLVNATAQDAKTKIRLGETQIALEEQLNALQPKPQESRQVRRQNERNRRGAHGNGNAAQPAEGSPA